MAITVTLTPNVTSYVYGEPAINVSILGQGNATTGPNYLWESNSGTFVDKFAGSTNFTPNNATSVVNIIGRRVKHFNAASAPNAAAFGANGGYQKIGGSTTAWDAGLWHDTSLTAYPSFYEFEPVEVNTEKAGGFFTNGTYLDPTVVNANPNVTFTFNWHLLANGTAVPRKAGVALASPVIYKVGDIFRVTVEVSKVVYTLNNIVVATTTRPVTDPLWAVGSIKTVGGTINNPSFFHDPTNEGLKTLSVTGLFPVQPNYSYELAADTNTLTSLAEDGSGTFRKKGNQKRAMSLQFNERPYTEYKLIYDFWRAHEKHEKFIYQDLVFNDVYIMRFEAGLRSNVIAPDSITIQITLKEA
jgi:hypothetical protein